MIKSDQPTIFNNLPVEIFVSSKEDGNMSFRSGHDTENTPSNLKMFIGNYGLEPNSVAGVRIEYGERNYDLIQDFGDLREGNNLLDYSTWVVTDAIFLSKTGTSALLPIADCMGVVFYDQAKNVLCLAHIGWHASADDLPKKVIDHFQAQYQSNPSDILVYISPSIRKESYLVQQPSQLSLPAWEKYLKSARSGYYVDIVGFTRNQLVSVGVRESSIEISPTDTAKSQDYFSHYMALQDLDSTGRFAILAALR